MDYLLEKGRELAVGTVTGLLKKWYAESKPGKDLSQTNRFKYDADNVRLHGREEELALLWEFCHADSHFSWYAISGEGGTGKTRLAHTLGELIAYEPDKRGHWKYCKVDYAHNEGLAKAKASLDATPCNTLFVLDYVKWHTDSIGDWLYSLRQDWDKRDIKIRVLLVERDAIHPEDDLRWKHDVLAALYRPSLSFSGVGFLDKNNLMRLQPLEDADIIRVVEDYAASSGQQELVDSSLVLSTLKEKVDPKLRRPLYALFLADAQITGENLLKWEREDALQYIYLKEKTRIGNNASGIPKNIVAIICRSLLVATLSGGMPWDKFAQLLPKECALLQKYADDNYTEAPQVVAECLGFPCSGYEPLFISPLEPDLMGEYFCIQELWHLSDKLRQEIVGLAMLNDLRRAAVVFDRIAHDYGDMLPPREMKKLFTEIILPDNMESIGENAFADCTNLVSIIIPKSVSSIGGYAFSNCSSLNAIAIPDNVTCIKNYTFSKCSNLKEVSIGCGISDIADWAFVYCYNLGATSVAEANAHYSSQNGVLFDKKKMTLVQCPDGMKGVYNIPNGVTRVSDFAFEDCTSLTSIAIPISVTTIGALAFAFCSNLVAVNVAGNSHSFFSQDGVLFTSDKRTLVAYPAGREGSYTIPRSVDTIAVDAFYSCEKLTFLTISSKLTNINRFEFSSCINLQTVYVMGKMTRTIRKAFEGMDITFIEQPQD